PVGNIPSTTLCHIPRHLSQTHVGSLHERVPRARLLCFRVLVWLGRRRIPGIEPGRTVKAKGRIAVRDGRKVLYNPYYELQTTT
ncbi:hypothetical protein ACFQ1S_22485, partial [Kibdelosporangium lantanae]